MRTASQQRLLLRASAFVTVRTLALLVTMPVLCCGGALVAILLYSLFLACDVASGRLLLSAWQKHSVWHCACEQDT